VLGNPEWLFIGLPFLGIFWATMQYAPRAYRLAPDGVRIERRAGDIVVPYEAIVAVDRERRGLTGFGAGSKGFLGWFSFGRAWRPSLGRYRLALTNRRDVVWLRTTSGWIAVSPDPPDAFVDRLRARLVSRSGTIRGR
jgi:PH (Pleckstrin Homology) domain-containing protein